MEITAQKFASITKGFYFPEVLTLAEEFQPHPGILVAVEVLTENAMYPDLELVNGSYTKISVGDIVVGVLGSRQALRGFVGYSPYRVGAGETLHLLNMGGVIGRFVDGHPDLGEAARVKLLGAVLQENTPMHLGDIALPVVDTLGPETKPIVLVAGSCMHVGKTSAAVELIKQFTAAGYKVAAAKIAGVACLRDTRKMESAGAVATATFANCGLPSTVDTDNLPQVAKKIAGHLSGKGDVIVMEFGDGLLGHYGVDSVLEDGGFMGRVSAVVFSASDIMSAWGGIEYMTRRGISVAALTGPVTDTRAGTEYLETTLNLSAANAALEGEKLRDLVMAHLPILA